MEIKPNDYIVVVISSVKNAESSLLQIAGRKNEEEWCYLAINSSFQKVKVISKPADCASANTNGYSFFLINPACYFLTSTHKCNDKCNGKVKNLLKQIKGSNKKIVVWLHETDRIECSAIEMFFTENLVLCEKFHHSDNPQNSNEPVEIFMFEVCKNNDKDNFQKKFKELINTCDKKKAKNDAHTLRADILTPFIPFHLFHQLENKDSNEWQDIFKECCSVINNTDRGKNIEEKFKKLTGLKKDIPSEIKKCADNKFSELKKHFHIGENDCIKNVEKNDCPKIIENFAQCLEKIVNCIESGEEASAKNK